MRRNNFGIIAFAGMCGASSAIAAEQVEEQLPLSRMPASGEEIIVTRTAGGDVRASLRRNTAASAPLPLPLGSDLQSLSSARVFGVDERCTISRVGPEHRLTCVPGATTSGLLLNFPSHRLPAGGSLQLVAKFSGDPGFRVEVTRKGEDALKPAIIAAGSSRVKLPKMGVAEPQLVILAPPEGGKLNIEGLEIGSIASAPPVNATAAWAWKSDAWQSDAAVTLAVAIRRGIDRIFITLDVEQGRLKSQGALQAFVRAAKAAGIEVEAVEGDPRMVLTAGREHALARARAFATYQRQATAPERLAGIQYDVEPYTLAEWGGAPAEFEAWADAIIALSHAANEPVDLVLPFWIAQQAGGNGFLVRVAPVVRGVTVMSYRTSIAELTQVAEPLLAWDASNGVGIRLALEAGSLPDEEEEAFGRDHEGTLGVFLNQPPRAVLVHQPTRFAGALMFESRRKVSVRASRISFNGDEDKMQQVADQAGPLFSAWRSFRGFALHGVRWTS